jgi:hypothetical protein
MKQSGEQDWKGLAEAGLGAKEIDENLLGNIEGSQLV